MHREVSHLVIEQSTTLQKRINQLPESQLRFYLLAEIVAVLIVVQLYECTV